MMTKHVTTMADWLSDYLLSAFFFLFHFSSFFFLLSSYLWVFPFVFNLFFHLSFCLCISPYGHFTISFLFKSVCFCFCCLCVCFHDFLSFYLYLCFVSMSSFWLSIYQSTVSFQQYCTRLSFVSFLLSNIFIPKKLGRDWQDERDETSIHES